MAVVAHHFWGTLGGGELVNAAAATALSEAGYNVALSGVFRFDKAKYLDWFGIDLRPYPVVTLFPFGAKAFGLLSRSVVWIPAKKAVKKYKASLLWFGAGAATYKPLLEHRKRGLKIVEYIHFPVEIVFDKKFAHLMYGEGFLESKYGRFPMNLYWKIAEKSIRRYLRQNPFNDADLVFANSKWTAQIVKEVYGEMPHVLNPPIAPNVEVVETPKPFEERKPQVVMLGRFSQEKRYVEVIGLAKDLVKEIPGFKLVICGSATSRSSRAYLDKVRETVRKLGLNHVVELYPNAARKTILQLLDESMAFLHATINEHWGIAVAEALARGLPAVVHKSGGAWTDLAEEGEVGLGYSTLDEARQGIIKLLTDRKTWEIYSKCALEKAKSLKIDIFKNNLKTYINAIGFL